MSDRVDVSGRIAVDDAASPVIKKIEACITKMGATAKRIGTSMRKFANMGAFGGVAKNAKNAAVQVGRLGGSMFRMLTPIAALAGAAGFAGLTVEMQKYITTTDHLAKTASKIGISVEMLQKLRHAAELSGVGIDEMDSALGRLNKNIGAASSGKDKKLAGLFQRLGISLKDSNGQMKTAADLMPQLANAFQKNTNAVTRTEMALALFGKSGAGMINMLSGGKASLEEMMAEMEKLGIITSEQAKVAEEANDAQHRFKTAIQGVTNTIMASLLPSLIPVIKHMTEWVAANREWIATGIEKFIGHFAAGLAKIPWQAIGEGFAAFGAALAEAVTAAGGFETVIPALAVVLGGVLLSSIWAAVAAIGALSVAFVTNPIGLAVVAIGAAAYALWKNWDEIAGHFSEMWAQIGRDFDGAVAWFAGFADLFTPEGFMAAWGNIAAWFAGIWSGISDVFADAVAALGGFVTEFLPAPLLAAWAPLQAYFSALWGAIGATFDLAAAALGAFIGLFQPGGIEAAWEGLKAFFAGLWGGVEGGFGAFAARFMPEELLAAWAAFVPAMAAMWEAIGGLWEAALAALAAFGARFIPEPIERAWAGLTAFFTGLWAGITGAFERAWAVISPIVDKIAAAVGVVTGAASKVAAIGGSIAGAAKGAIDSVLGTGGAPAEAGAAPASQPGWLARQFGAGAAPAPGPVAQATQAQPVAKLDGEVQTHIKVDLAPGLRGTATTTDRGDVRSDVNVGQSMAPA